MENIPSYVSVHFTRHKIGVEHFVQTMRTDRGAEKVADRNTPVNHAMFINAQSLINMARKRLCRAAAPEAVELMELIKEHVQLADPDLAICMVPEGIYRGGRCVEGLQCGRCL